MILKRPFAFLIKHFRLIHLFLCIPIFYLLYRTSLILNFITEYLQTDVNVVGTKLVSSLFDFKIVLSIAIILIGSIIIIALMAFKRKPVTFYFYTILTYICISVVFAFNYSIIQTMETGLVDVRTIKIAQDLIVTSILLQIVSSVLFVIRATGFDIKKFNFKYDLEELQIDSYDDEEIEIETGFDTDKLKRKIRRILRHAKYVYVENKLVVMLAILLVIGGISYAIYNNSGVYNKNYELSVAINTDKFVFNIKNNYETSKNYRGNIITDNKLIVIDFSAKKNSNVDEIDLTRFDLNVGNKTYRSIDTYDKQLSDLGNVYNGDKLTEEFQNYLLVFEIPTEMNNGKKTLIYRDYNGKNIKIKLNPANIDEIESDDSVNISEKIDLKETLLSPSTFLIGNFGFANPFKLEYNFCISNSECYTSYEYLTPTYTDNYRKTLFKISGIFEPDENYDNSNIKNFSDLITTYGKLEYTLNNEKKIIYLTKLVKPEKVNSENDLYIEINSEIEQASNIAFVLEIRNRKYTYVIR